MESDKNPFPKMELFNPIQTLKRLGSTALDYLSFPCITEESTRPRGAAEMLDQHLYEQLEIDYGSSCE